MGVAVPPMVLVGVGGLVAVPVGAGLGVLVPLAVLVGVGVESGAPTKEAQSCPSALMTKAGFWRLVHEALSTCFVAVV